MDLQGHNRAVSGMGCEVMSPQEFDNCIATPGSKKVTKALPEGKYVHGCKLPGSSKWIWSEVKEKQGERLKRAIRG